MTPFIQIGIRECPGGYRARLYDWANKRGRVVIARTLDQLLDRIDAELALYKP